jgi:HK97 family phage major capsid protein
MKTVTELQADREFAIRSCADILDKAKKDDERALAAEEKAQLTTLQQNITRVDGEILERQTLDTANATVAAQMDSLTSKRIVSPTAPARDGDVPVKPNVVPHARRYGKLRAFKGHDAEQRAYRSGKFLQAALFGNAEADRWCGLNGIDWRAMAVGVNTAGGFLAPDEFGTAIIDLREEYGVFRRECSVVPMSRDIMTIPRRAGGVTATITGENTALTESDATFNQVTLTAHKLGVLTRISTEIAEDAIINITDWLAQEFAYAFAKWEDDTGFAGDGTASVGGIRGANIKLNDTSLAGGFEAAAGIDLFSEVTINDLHSLMGTLPAFAHDGAKWYCSQACADVVFQRLAAAGGGNTMITLAGKFGREFLGYPIVISQSMPTSIGSLDAAVMFLFGNLGQAATLGDRRQIVVGLSTDRYFVEDQIGIKATARIDINIHDIGDTSTAGPIVAYIGNVA